jgi:choline monooxygenase
MIERDWKLFVQNVKESYHIATVHRNTINKYALGAQFRLLG